MNFLSISSKAIPQVIKVPTSKSYANRALILAALDSNECRVSNVSWSQDVMDMLEVLKKVGLEVYTQQDQVIVKNSFPACEEKQKNTYELEINLGEGGTTSRFLVAMLSLGKRRYVLHAKNRMQMRPMKELYDSLKMMEVNIELLSLYSFPIALKGPIKNEIQLEVDCSKTTQFYSALLMLSKALPLDMTPVNLHGSKGYVNITKKLLTTFSKDYSVPVDFSGASYPIAYAALNQELTISNCLDIDNLQGDSILLEVIRKSGAKYFFDAEGLHIRPTENFKSFSLDCSDCPDLVPTLCYLAAYAEGESKLTSIANLRQKESDRIEGVINLMRNFEVDCSYDSTKDELKIKGRERDKKARKVSVEPDHRMVMSATLFLKHNAGGELSSCEAVAKSFPGFFDIF